MSKDSFDMEKLARQFFRDNKKVLDLITERSAGSGFAPAVDRLFGDNPQRGKSVRIGNHKFMYASIAKNLVSFLPARWQEELDKTKGTWPGCEKWWAGYPFIAWVERGDGEEGSKGYLRLHAEVGPISNHRVRKGIIEAITVAASQKGMRRIRFPAGASDEGRLYSRFLRQNSTAVNDIRDTHEIERKFVQLVADFETEFELVATVIPQFLRLHDALQR